MANLPVPIPRTFTVGEIEVGAYFNALRDALNFLLNPPETVLFQTTIQAVGTSAWSAISFDTSTQDTYGAHSNTTNNTRMTAQVAGWCQVGGTFAIAANGTGGRQSAVAKNGVQIPTSLFGVPASSLINEIVQSATVVQLAVGDYVEVQGWQSAGTTLNTVSTFSGMTTVWAHA